MYGLVKLAEEKVYPGYSREDLLRERLDNANDEYDEVVSKIPSKTVSDQNNAFLKRSLGGLGLGLASGAATGALLKPKNKSALLGFGAGGGLLGAGVGSVLGNMKKQEILTDRHPEIADALNEKQRQINSADHKLWKHVNSYNPELELKEKLLEIEKQKARYQSDRDFYMY